MTSEVPSAEPLLAVNEAFIPVVLLPAIAGVERLFDAMDAFEAEL
jgi:hypothetical protein